MGSIYALMLLVSLNNGLVGVTPIEYHYDMRACERALAQNAPFLEDLTKAMGWRTAKYVCAEIAPAKNIPRA